MPMYEAFYGFTEKPFSLLPDPSFLYLSENHSTALAMLEYGVMEQAGFTVITGEIGSGKTTLVRHLLDHMEDGITVGLITNTHQSMGELLQLLLLGFGLEYRGKNNVECYETLVDFLISEYADNRRTILIVDEAQNMDADTLEELRMLSNLNADKHQVLQLILVGQPELQSLLRNSRLRQFTQRIAVNYHLTCLGRNETREYIRHRVSVAGGNPSLFRPGAYDVVYDHSRGIPRVINVLCDTTLVYGYSARRKRIDAQTVQEVVRDKINAGLFEEQQPENVSVLKSSSEATSDRVRQAREWLEPPSTELTPDIARELFSGLRKRAPE